MNKNLKIALVSITVVILVIIGVNVYAAITSNIELINEGETLTSDNFKITLNDAYNADFTIVDELDYTFDKYLAVDLSIKNISNKEQRFTAFKKFYLDDGTNNARHFLIDENRKKFGTTLEENESFDLTLVFPVDNATEYTLFYNKTLKDEDDKRVGFTIDGTNLKTKKVKTTVDHYEVNLDEENEDSSKEENNE